MPLTKLFILFLRLSFWTFGGGIVLLRLLERELVKKEVLTPEAMQETVTLAVSVPGSIMANLAFLTGRRLHGWAGAIVAVVGTALPPFAVILAVAGTVFGNGEPAPWIRAFLWGVLASVTALVLDVALERLRSLSHQGTGAFVIFAVVLGASLWGLHPLGALAAGTLLAIPLLSGSERP